MTAMMIDIVNAILKETVTGTRTKNTGVTETIKTERKKEAEKTEALRVCLSERSMKLTKCVPDLDFLLSDLEISLINFC